jgi:hypothetical protein
MVRLQTWKLPNHYKKSADALPKFMAAVRTLQILANATFSAVEIRKVSVLPNQC